MKKNCLHELRAQFRMLHLAPPTAFRDAESMLRVLQAERARLESLIAHEERSRDTDTEGPH